MIKSQVFVDWQMVLLSEAGDLPMLGRAATSPLLEQNQGILIIGVGAIGQCFRPLADFVKGVQPVLEILL
jgi:hypothetical protein